MTKKKCTACEEEKSLDEFSREGKYPSGKIKFKSRCKACLKIIAAEYNARPDIKDRNRLRDKKRHEEYVKVKEKYYNFLKENPCVDCGEDDILFLECDHVRGEKTMTIGQMMMRYRSWEKIQEEIAKCEVRCVRCHRLVTAIRGDWLMLKYR